MNPPLHPDLARLQLEYDQILDRFESDHITLEQARATLAALSVIDADGAVWGLDEDGNFVRRRTPEAPPEQCNPALFAVARAPGGPQPAPFPTSPWETGPLPRPGDAPPASPRPPVSSAPAAGGGPGGEGRFDPPVDVGPFAAPPRMPDPDGLPPETHREPRERRAPRRAGRLAALREAAGPFVDAHRTTLLVVAAVVVILLGSVWARGDGSSTGNGTAPGTSLAPGVTTSLPVSTMPAGPSTTAGTEPTAAPSTAAPTTAAPVGAAPTATDTDLVISNLTSAQREVAVKMLMEPGTPATVARELAFYAGLVKVQLGIRTGEAIVDDSGVHQAWALFDRATGQDVAVSAVQWRNDGSVWKLATWPRWADAQGG